jgi:hypothetical protein
MTTLPLNRSFEDEVSDYCGWVSIEFSFGGRKEFDLVFVLIMDESTGGLKLVVAGIDRFSLPLFVLQDVAEFGNIYFTGVDNFKLKDFMLTTLLQFCIEVGEKYVLVEATL